jgi:hypothetical protein
MVIVRSRRIPKTIFYQNPEGLTLTSALSQAHLWLLFDFFPVDISVRLFTYFLLFSMQLTIIIDMARFFIETKDLFPYERLLRFEYEENADGSASIKRIYDPVTKEEVSIEELIGNGNPDMLANIGTAYKAGYERTYIK